MNHEAVPWIEMGPATIPFLDPKIGMESAEFAYTPAQRRWWLRVYEGKCHFPNYSEEKGFTICGDPHDKQEVHHILPCAMTLEQTPWLDPNDLHTTLGILIGQREHHIIHPDIGLAAKNYWKVPEEERRNVFKDAIHEHHALARQGIVFWNPDYDTMMMQVAQYAVQSYLRAHPNDQYPRDHTWLKKPHPKKPHWSTL